MWAQRAAVGTWDRRACRIYTWFGWPCCCSGIAFLLIVSAFAASFTHRFPLGVVPFLALFLLGFVFLRFFTVALPFHRAGGRGSCRLVAVHLYDRWCFFTGCRVGCWRCILGGRRRIGVLVC